VKALREGGATVLGTPAELAAQTEVVLTALPTEDIVKQIYDDMGAVASKGQLYADHSTVSPGSTGAARKSLRSNARASSMRRSLAVRPAPRPER